MLFRINDLMITVLPMRGEKIEAYNPTWELSPCPGCSDMTHSDTCPPSLVDPAELIELRELLRQTISVVEAQDLSEMVLPNTSEGINALEAKLQGALNELRDYKATKVQK
ncbi:hypothetical protein [Bacillus cereus]|uniref:hypothetical protein n=1 Tax=Bacillus cereus TaxID=1396 RepID=UPI000BF5E9E2|nr:hypothetical protein [Bacillus cereus]PEY75484.1 hypothetical protein CN344_22480 [Bacillus cereus]PGP75232.1 hypothetical protein CN999_31105 [Bacillus cereus]